jgi:hypothetical protein
VTLLPFNSRPTPAQLRWFGCLWLPLCALGLALSINLENGNNAASLTATLVAAASILVGIVSPQALRPVFVGLLLLSYPVGFVISHLAVLVIYFVIITPVALLMRLTGRDVLGLRFDREAKTYWRPHPGRATVARYFRQT